MRTVTTTAITSTTITITSSCLSLPTTPSTSQNTRGMKLHTFRVKQFSVHLTQTASKTCLWKLLELILDWFLPLEWNHLAVIKFPICLQFICWVLPASKENNFGILKLLVWLCRTREYILKLQQVCMFHVVTSSSQRDSSFTCQYSCSVPCFHSIVKWNETFYHWQYKEYVTQNRKPKICKGRSVMGWME